MARVEEHWTPTVLHLMAAEVQYAFRCCMHVTSTEKAQRSSDGQGEVGHCPSARVSRDDGNS